MPSRDEAARVAAVNEFYNQRIGFRSDHDLYGVSDHWASPLETLARGAGDCEDFAIAKYFTLVASGIPQRKLRLVYVRAMDLGLAIPHMVLAYYPMPDADPWVLDNLVHGLRPASARPDLTPVFSFNAEAIWEGVGTAPVKGAATERLSRWAAVLKKAREEGF
ncbi:MAG: transglutaminase-like cysteine peptidase [Burkholderiales bacterium]|nr:transglutaminase-like cysteine peptidase [Burkholderiales bacterium]